jgi:BirA family biotin operon repressor/biotin-[acetyl-CoA-carboxylase] ligase
MSRLGALSLAIAVAMMRSFKELGAEGLGIKWPNDIISEQGKLAGILVDVAGETSGPCHAVIGIGVNYSMSRTHTDSIDQPWIQLTECGVTEGRNGVTASLLNYLIQAFIIYQQQGFEPFRQEWLENDMLRNREVVVKMTNGSITGIARGIDQGGLLQVEQQGEIRTYAAGEVSLRRASE